MVAGILAAMGDSELDGTGIETSLNGKLRFTVHKANNLPAFLQNQKYIIAEVSTLLHVTQQ